MLHFEHFFPYSIPPFLTMIAAFFLASVTLRAGREHRSYQLFTVYSLLQGVFYLHVTLETLWTSKVVALYFARCIFMIYVFIIPVSVHFIHNILGITKRQWLLRGLYLSCILFLFVIPTSHFITANRDSFYAILPVPNEGFHLFILFSIAAIVYGISLLWAEYRKVNNPFKQRMIKYVLSGIVLSGVMTLTHAFPMLGISIYPPGNFGFLPLALMAYGILQHQLLDTTKSWLSQETSSKIIIALIWSPVFFSLLFVLFSSRAGFRNDLYQHFLNYSIPPLFTVIVCFGVTSFCLTRSKMKVEHFLFGLMCWLWGGLALEMLFTENLREPGMAILIVRINHFFLVNQTALSLHLGYRIVNRSGRKLVIFNYLLGFFFMFWTHTPHYYKDTMSHYMWGFYPQGNWAFQLFSINGILILLWVMVLLLQHWMHETDEEKSKQIFYIFIGLVVVSVFNFGSIPAVMGMNIYPLGNFTFLAVMVTAYGIFRHDVLHINSYAKKRIIEKTSQLLIVTGYVSLICLFFWAWRSLSWSHIFNRLTPYTVPSLISFLSCLFLSFVLLRMPQKQKEVWVFNFMCLCYAFLSLDFFLAGFLVDLSVFLIITRWDQFFLVLLMLGLNLHLLFLLTHDQRHLWLSRGGYFMGFLMASLSHTQWYFQDSVYSYFWGVVVKKAILFDVMSSLWLLGTIYVIVAMYKVYRNTKQVYEKHRLTYVMFGYLVTALLSLGNIPALNGFELYPPSNFLFIPILLFAYGLLVHNKKELVQTIRLFVYWSGLAGFVLLLCILLLNTGLVQPSLGHYLLGSLIILTSTSFFSQAWHAVLFLFFEHEKEALQQAFTFIMELLSRVTRHRELYQFVSYSLFKILSSNRCTLLVQTSSGHHFSGWSYLSFQSNFFSTADPLNESECPVEIINDSMLLIWLKQQKAGVTQEEVEEWIYTEKSPQKIEPIFLEAEWIQPIFYEDQLSGLLLLGGKTNSAVYTQMEKEFLYQLSMALGPHIHTLNMIQVLENKVQERTEALSVALIEAKNKEQEISHFSQVIQAINSSMELDNVLGCVRNALQTFFEFDQLGIWLIDEERQALNFVKVYGEGVSDAQVERMKKVRLSLAHQGSWFIKAIHDNEPKYVSPITNEILCFFDEKDLEIHQQIRSKSYLFYPMEIQQKVIGVIAFGHSTTPFELTDDQVFKTQRYIAPISNAINNVNLLAQTKKAFLEAQAKEQEIVNINQVVQAVNSTLDLDKVVDTAKKALLEIFHFEVVSIMVVDEAQQVVVTQKVYGDILGPELIKQFCNVPVPLNSQESAVTYSLHTGNPLYIPVVESSRMGSIDKQFYDIYPFHSLLLMPLSVQGNVIGFMNFFSLHEAFHLDESDILKIQNFVTQIANAVYNAHLTKEIEHINASLEQKVEEQTKELKLALEKLQEADKLKDEFLANTSHELKTPLHGIIGLGEALLDGTVDLLNKEQAYSLQMIIQSGKRLSSLVNDILDFSKMKHHELQLQLKVVDIKSISNIVMALSTHLIANKPITLNNQIPDDLPLVSADESRLQQILLNLIGNAIKFTWEGNVTIFAKQVGANLQIDVSDTGIGIAEEHQEIIFQSFKQADGSISREFGGTGLGLAVTQQLVELQGGKIEVKSQEGKGSVFSFQLPIASTQILDSEQERNGTLSLLKGFSEQNGDNASGLLMQNEQEADSLPEGTTVRTTERVSLGQTILVVDDEVVNVHILKSHLQLSNYKILTAYDGIQALELLSQHVPDLILLDVMMPRMSGYEVCQKIRESYSSIVLPVIMLTAKNQVIDLVEGFQSGANDYLTKPFHKKELLSRVQMHLQLKMLAFAMKESERQQMELKTAQTVQKRLLPQFDPQLEEIEIASFYQSASESGGDWYDYGYYQDTNRLDVVIGDVTGHGVSAALITAMADSIYHSMEEHHRRIIANGTSHQLLHPTYFLELLNNLMIKSTDSSYAMTFFYSAIDLKKKNLLYSNAGHNPCFIFRPSQFKFIRNGKEHKSSILHLKSQNAPLGYDSDAVFKMDIQPLQTEDVLIWYTDGLVENTNAQGQMFGSMPLKWIIKQCANLNASEIKDRIISAFHQHCGDYPPDDDITLIVAKIK
ncbi:SpoIIE family protein phosphatase [Deltaproteobacteria bacterium TL4]